MTAIATVQNHIKFTFPAMSENESLARTVVAAFVMSLDPMLDELNDLKTAVSEAVTNAIIHGYDERNSGMIDLEAELDGRTVFIRITDYGRGIHDLWQARQPMYTSKPDLERPGMGFTMMEHLMDEVTVQSVAGRGTTIGLRKTISPVDMRWH